MPLRLRAAFLVMGLSFASGLPAIPAQAADLAIPQATLDKGKGGKVTFKNVTLKDCNLSQDEAAKLFSGALPPEDAAAMVQHMTAVEARIAEIDMETGAGDRLTVKDVVAEKIAGGGAQTLTVASTDGVVPDDAGDSTLHFGTLRIDRVSLLDLAGALRAGDPARAALRFSHLSWDGGDLTAVDKGTPAGAPGGNRIAIHVGPAKVDQNFDSRGAPLDAAASLTGLSLKMPPESRLGAVLNAYGYPQIDADLTIGGAYDPATKTYQLKNYAIDLKKIGRVAISAQFSALNETAFLGDKEAREKAILDATLDWARIEVDNAGLFDKVVAFASLSQGKTPASVKEDWRAIIAQAPLLFSGPPAIAILAKELERFVADPKVLTLTIKGKGSPLKVSEFVHIEDPTDFLNRLDITGSPAPAKPAKPAAGTKL
ncbi:hypothetical protein [Rhodoblastus sp.]|uniref:hypothetical protein n=1 Tax=Rhodoblastus sp. TaxID=1962975 RepID=UPI002607AED9|nr:hypothetical protein [Rhodoblastus sp.]